MLVKVKKRIINRNINESYGSIHFISRMNPFKGNLIRVEIDERGYYYHPITRCYFHKDWVITDIKKIVRALNEDVI